MCPRDPDDFSSMPEDNENPETLLEALCEDPDNPNDPDAQITKPLLANSDELDEQLEEELAMNADDEDPEDDFEDVEESNI